MEMNTEKRVAMILGHLENRYGAVGDIVFCGDAYPSPYIQDRNKNAWVAPAVQVDASNTAKVVEVRWNFHDIPADTDPDMLPWDGHMSIIKYEEEYNLNDPVEAGMFIVGWGL